MLLCCHGFPGQVMQRGFVFSNRLENYKYLPISLPYPEI